MTTNELISDLRACGPQSLSVTLHFIAERVPALTLLDGQHLRDAGDFRAALIEMAAAARIPAGSMSVAPENTAAPAKVEYPLTGSRFNLDFCPRCGHVHIEDDECGFPMGAGGACPCTRAVPA